MGSENVGFGRSIRKGLVFGGQRFFGREIFVRNHGIENLGLAVFGRVGISKGGVARRGLRKTGKQGGLFKRKVAGVFIEEAVSGSFDAVGSPAIGNVIEVHFKDLGFGVK